MSKPRILVIDDSAQVHDRVRRAFERQPVSVEVTDSIVTAQAEAFSSTPPDLIVLDIQMPVLGGPLLGRAIKRRVSIPIVIFSSETPARMRDVQEYVGAEAAVSKSAPDAELVGAVMRLLGAPLHEGPASDGTPGA